MLEFIESLNSKELFNYLKEIAVDSFYIYYLPNNEYNITDVIENIEKSIYIPLNDKVTYTDELGNKVETKENIRIGQLYFMILEKIANTYSAVSSNKINNFEFSIKCTSYDKYKYLHSLTPTKTLGETFLK